MEQEFQEVKNIPQQPNNPVYMSEDISELALALSEFQGTIIQPGLEKEVSVKTKQGYTYTFKYADLSTCMKAAAPCLKATGLAVTQIVSSGKLITILTHKSGQWIKSVVQLPQQSTDYQSFGSALTYLKRYTYCGILGIVADADDDANYAQGNQVKEITKESNTKNQTTDQIYDEAIEDLNKISSLEEFNAVYNKWNDIAPGMCANGTPFYKELTKVYKKFKSKVEIK